MDVGVFYAIGMLLFEVAWFTVFLVQSVLLVVVIDCNWFPQKLSILTLLLVQGSILHCLMVVHLCLPGFMG